MKRENAYILAAAAVMLAAFFAIRAHRATAAPFPDLLELAPADSSVIGYADLEVLRQSPLVQQLAAMAKPVEVDRDYSNFVSATGFDYQRDLDHLLVVSRAGGGSASAMVLAEGRFNRQKIEQYALRSGRRVEENGRAGFIVPSSTPGRNIALAFLSADRIALSDGGDLPPLTAATSPAFDDAMRERLSRIAGAPIFAEIKASDFSSRIASGGSGPAAGLSGPFQSLRWVSLALQPEGQQVILSAEGECDDAAQAQKIAGTLELLRGVMRGALADPKARGRMPAASAAAAAKLLDNMQITTETARTRILLPMTPEIFGLSQASPAAPR